MSESVAAPTSFTSPVEARAYAMAIAVAQSLGGGWNLVQPQLARAIATRPDASYTECLLDAVEALVNSDA